MEDMADKKMNQFTTSKDYSYVYGEDYSKNQIKIGKVLLSIKIEVTINKGEIINLGAKEGLLFVHYASAGNAAIYLIDSYRAKLIISTDSSFFDTDGTTGIRVYRTDTNRDIYIKQFQGDNVAIWCRWI